MACESVLLYVTLVAIIYMFWLESEFSQIGNTKQQTNKTPASKIRTLRASHLLGHEIEAPPPEAWKPHPVVFFTSRCQNRFLPLEPPGPSLKVPRKKEVGQEVIQLSTHVCLTCSASPC